MCHTTALSLACPLYKHRGLPTEDRPEKLHNVEPVVYLRLNIQRYRFRIAWPLYIRVGGVEDQPQQASYDGHSFLQPRRAGDPCLADCCPE